MRRVEGYILTICAAVLLCGCYNSTRLPGGKGSDLKPNMSLAELRNLWHGKTVAIDEPFVVGGYVTSSDVAGNFYQTFTISDGERAVEIMAGMRDLHNSYPLGCYLCVKLEGCAVGVERGVLQIGLMPASYSNYAVDYFYSRAVIDQHLVRSGEVVDVEALPLDVASLDESMCGLLVRIEDLQLVVEEVDPSEDEEEIAEPEPATWSGYRKFVDMAGNLVFTYTSDYANYAAEEVPTTMCAITGILQRGKVSGVPGDSFILKMRSKDDCVAIDNGSL